MIPSGGKMACFGLIKRQERWSLILCGWLALLIIVVTVLLLAIVKIHPFLAVTNPIEADVLVLEGWLPDYALKEAIDEFKANKYRLLITTGLPIAKGFYLTEYKTYAELAAATLKKLGFDEKLIMVVPGPPVLKDRTYAAALALQKRLQKLGITIKSINLFSLGVHTRRSRLLFEKALGAEIEIGTIAAENLSYAPQKWWKSSEGVRNVIDETVAYFYARFLFHPQL